jgi:hypothetical protein
VVRIITYYEDDAELVASIIHHEFEVDTKHSVDKSTELEVDEFGYRSLHFVVHLGESRRRLAEWRTLAAFSAEIQVRSVLQHAWAAISHKLDNKRTSQAPPELRRRLFRLSALLELADEGFSELRDAGQEVAAHYRREVDRGELELPLNLDSLRQYLEEKAALPRWAQLATAAGAAETPAALRLEASAGPRSPPPRLAGGRRYDNRRVRQDFERQRRRYSRESS